MHVEGANDGHHHHHHHHHHRPRPPRGGPTSQSSASQLTAAQRAKDQLRVKLSCLMPADLVARSPLLDGCTDIVRQERSFWHRFLTTLCDSRLGTIETPSQYYRPSYSLTDCPMGCSFLLAVARFRRGFVLFIRWRMGAIVRTAAIDVGPSMASCH